LLRGADVPFAFASMVTHLNVACVTGRDWFDEVWSAGARFGFLIDYVPVGCEVQGDLVLTGADRAAKAEAVERRYEEARPLVMNFPPDEYASGECQAAGRGMVHVNADGYVEPCPFSHFAADNVRDKPLAEILASEFFSRLRAEVAPLENPRGQCALTLHAAAVGRIAADCDAICTEKL
ncbi:unnamed protein product, partial [marine sediment metagenome]